MKIKHQLSIATLVMVGFFATGCSQQSADSSQVAGGSQVSGGSQQQVEGGSQVAGASQGGSQQQVEEAAVVAPVAEAVTRAPAAVRPAPVRRVAKTQTRRRVSSGNRWTHYHAEAPKCAKTRRHTHKYRTTGAPHRHRYACSKQQRRQVTRRAAPARRAVAAPYRPRNVRRAAAPRPPVVDVRALQRKLKTKGFYRGPIDGIVGPGTRSALKRFMNR